MASCVRCRAQIGGILDDLVGGLGRNTCETCAAFLSRALHAWVQRLNWHFAGGTLTQEAEGDLRAYQHHLRLTDHDMGAVFSILARARAITTLNLGNLPQVSPGNVMLPRGEQCHFAAPCSLYEEQTQRAYVSQSTTSTSRRGFTGKYFRAAGSSSSNERVGQWVQTSQMVCVAQGVFLVTSANVRFVSHAMETFPLENVLSVNAHPNALELMVEGQETKKKIYTLHAAEVAAATLFAVRRKLDDADHVTEEAELIENAGASSYRDPAGILRTKR